MRGDQWHTTNPGSLEARGCAVCGFGTNIGRVKLPSGRRVALCDYHQVRINQPNVLATAEAVAAERPWQK